jgi:hypothetical protein
MPKFDLFVPLKIRALETRRVARKLISLGECVMRRLGAEKDSPASFIFSKVQNAILT